MKTVTVKPGEPGTARLEDCPKPKLTPGSVLVRVLEVGVDGTDRELHRGLGGAAPEESERLILGHESLGRVEQVAAGSGDWQEGDLVVPTVRRPCADPCPNCARGASDMCSTGRYAERGIERLHGFMTEHFVEQPEFLVSIPEKLRNVAVLLEPMSIVSKAIEQALQIQRRMVWEPRRALVLGAGSIGLLATMALRRLGVEARTVDRVSPDHSKATVVRATGAAYSRAQDSDLTNIPELSGYRPDLILEASGSSALAFGGMRTLGINGVLMLIGASGGNHATLVPTDETILELVLGNRTVAGCVNSNRTHFERALDDLASFEREWPGLLASMITRRLPLTGFAAALDSEEADGIKTILEVSPE